MGYICLVCNHTYAKNQCIFMKLPSDPEKLKQWKKILKLSRQDISKKNARVCCCHFPNYNKENLPINRDCYSTLRKRRVLMTKAATSQVTVSVDIPMIANKETNDDSVVVETIDELVDDVHIVDSSNDVVMIDAVIQCDCSFQIDAAVQVDCIRQKDSAVQTDCIPRLIDSDASVQTVIIDAVNSLVQTAESIAIHEVPYSVVREENKLQKKRIVELQNHILNMNLHFEFTFIENNDELVYRHTGTPTRDVFEIIFRFMLRIPMRYNQNWTVSVVPKREQLLMTLMKLKLNLRYFDLGTRFGCSIGTVCNIVRTWIFALHEILFVQLMNRIDWRKKNRLSQPKVFASFEDCRIVFDCTESSSDKPGNILCQRSTFSSYKKRNTAKPLLGCAPNGVVTYCSELYPGSLSDKAIVEHCGVIDQLSPGDLILADKGFLIEDIVPYGVTVNVPPFLTTKQFTKQQVQSTQTIARARVHIERAICKIKYFHVLDYIPSELFSIANEMFQVCVALTNLQHPLIREIARSLSG